ncbi:hypothetical protein NPIL_288751 [Nephila pilipes]|uniref:Uncharacterized protein n=1 Tax=Nephila pilipes TaxID=299642 RepID=A0A8X6QX96_NEPPI|nr:hypothetical protein NPIL_288751 [Nephila pilipes]
MLQIFDSFLYWPLQSKFLDVVNSFKPRLDKEIFLLLIALLLHKLECGWKDYEYANILKIFWEEFPSYHSSFEKKQDVLDRVNYVLNAPLPFDSKDFQKFIKREKRRTKIPSKQWDNSAELI